MLDRVIITLDEDLGLCPQSYLYSFSAGQHKD